MVIFWKYPLTDQRFRAIRNQTELRKQQEGTSSPPTGTSSTDHRPGCVCRGRRP
jgi:hypothetical protein